ncbi:ATP-grasp domain-containing protein, partial [Rhodopseudomonas sp. B29]|uniref:ATP-grasp domain-containing protein n=1 Tax=Rhodopseudomonas sp. B29 TaxID=95607 RepID=UPI0003B4FE91
MNLEEYAAKQHVLGPAGVPIPNGVVCTTADEAARAVEKIGPSVVKAQVPTGKRGKSGGIKMADTPEQATEAATAILGMSIGGNKVERVLIEQRCPIERELYAAVMVDVASRGPLVLFSTEGGMDIEEVAETKPDAIRKKAVDLAKGFGEAEATELLAGLDLGAAAPAVARVLSELYRAFCDKDAELIEINPLAVLKG